MIDLYFQSKLIYHSDPDLEIEVYVISYDKDLQIICMKQMEEQYLKRELTCN